MSEVKELGDIRTFEDWGKEYEKTLIALEWFSWLEQSGHIVPQVMSDVSNSKISWAKRKEDLAKYLLTGELIPVENLPQQLYFDAIASSLESATSALRTKIIDTGNEKVKLENYEINGHPVNLGSWRRFNGANVDDLETRKEVFKNIIELSYKHLKPLVEEFYNTTRESYGKYGLTPLKVFSQEVGLPIDKIKAIVHKSGELAKDPFLEMAEKMWPEVLGHSIAKEDDYYVWRPVIFSKFDSAYEKVKPMIIFSKIMKKLGMENFERYVEIDDTPRPNKSPSPVEYSIIVPSRNVIMFQRGRPFEDATSGFHEGGHAWHLSHIREDLPFYDRYLFPYAVIEIPSTLFESIATDPVFLEKELGMSKKNVAEVQERNRFNEMFYLQFYAALSMLKMEIYEKELNIDQAVERFGELTKKYGIELPGEYFLTHHIVPRYPLVYSPCYLLSKIREADLRHYLKEEFGEDWWNKPEAGEFLREEIAGPGNQVNWDKYSSLESERYFREVGILK